MKKILDSPTEKMLLCLKSLGGNSEKIDKIFVDSNKEKLRLRNLIKTILTDKPTDLEKVLNVCEIIKENYILDLVDFEIDIYNKLWDQVDNIVKEEEKNFYTLRDALLYLKYNNCAFDDLKIQNILCKHNKSLTIF